MIESLVDEMSLLQVNQSEDSERYEELADEIRKFDKSQLALLYASQVYETRIRKNAQEYSQACVAGYQVKAAKAVSDGVNWSNVYDCREDPLMKILAKTL